ncbi:lipase [Nocardioides humilatus]|uniref:Lipase n=1 Tax=Nocardioides humilatus TaxID=2607660 RepID=A0A5B1LJT3_9ACTN|nr:lipase family protein [Nocardioides humilatus]KAA1420942.1 lipase [Nocardioides humilatus]
MLPLRTRRTLPSALALCLALTVVTTTARDAQALQVATTLDTAGDVVAVEPLDESLWIPDATGSAYRLTYRTVDAHGQSALSTGALFVPQGDPPADGWPVVAWAHGTVGLGDECAPSAHPRSDRDATYLATWMHEGHAVLASDYAGLGTPGLMAYLDGRSTAANITDLVLAARSTAAGLPPQARLDDEWVVIGQSQGAGAAIQAARYATEDGGAALDFRGAVATGTPARIERLVQRIGANVPPVPLPGALNAYVIYILAGFRWAHPEVDVDSLLTPAGERYLALAETECLAGMITRTAAAPIGTFFSKRLSSLPGFRDALFDYLAMPESGFDRPFFMGHGLLDTDVPLVLTQPYVSALRRNHQPLTWKTYPTTHSGTMKASLPDTLPFVRKLFAG